MVKEHHVRVHRSDENLRPRGPAGLEDRRGRRRSGRGRPTRSPRWSSTAIIDNAAVAAASLNRAPGRRGPRPGARPTPSHRRQGRDRLRHRRQRVAPRVGGLGQRRRGARARLPRHLPGRRVLAPGRQHPADPRRRPARRLRAARDLVRGIATGYEIQVDLVKAICLHKHKIDHVAHLGPSAAAGIGTLLGLDVETIYQAVGQALHTTTATRQSRKGEISTWKAHAPAFAGKMAVEAVDRAMRGETCPVADLRGRGRRHRLDARRPGRLLRGAAARAGRGQARASSTRTPRSTRPSTRRRRWIDLARKLHGEHPESRDPAQRRVDRAAHQPPHALRDRLRRERPAEVRPHGSAARRSTTRSRTSSPSRCRTARGTTSTPTRPSAPAARTPSRCGTRSPPPRTPEWTRRYHSDDPNEKAFGGRVVITLDRRHRRSPTRSPSPTRTRSAPAVRARATTSASSARSPSRCSSRGRDRALPRRCAQRLPELDRRRARTSSPSSREPGVLDRRRRAEGTVLMLYSHDDPGAEKRAPLPRARSRPGELLRFPGAFNPLLRAADRGQGLRGRLHLRRRARRRPRACPTSG